MTGLERAAVFLILPAAAFSHACGDDGSETKCTTACSGIDGTWKYTDITCNGTAHPHPEEAYSAPCAQSIAVTGNTGTVHFSTTNCTVSESIELCCENTGEMTLHSTKMPTCTGGCACTQQSPSVVYQYEINDTTLTWTTSDSNEKVCTYYGNAHPTVITMTKQ